ncbi:hypothetical protein I6A84_16165 [Frankia sp. CNm7]|uniref:hypothetical protein n=1 Tax=Frankia nepalensis TaxID=1836974 RepID=UPI001932EC19|nr:hypothetical protein [Frankia nepalensis]MBL7519593.1 hypothetical protein [Frankia nepalensis]
MDVLTKVGDLERVRAGVRRALTRHMISGHPTPDGGHVLINWRAVGTVSVELAPTLPES